MSPKRAVVIILILAVLLGGIFTIIYLIKQSHQSKQPSGGVGQTASSTQALTPQEKIEQAVQQKIQQVRQENKGKIDQNEERQAVVDTINAEIMKIEQAKTPEQQAEELKEQAARQKTIDQINSKVNKTIK